MLIETYDASGFETQNKITNTDSISRNGRCLPRRPASTIECDRCRTTTGCQCACTHLKIIGLPKTGDKYIYIYINYVTRTCTPVVVVFGVPRRCLVGDFSVFIEWRFLRVSRQSVRKYRVAIASWYRNSEKRYSQNFPTTGANGTPTRHGRTLWTDVYYCFWQTRRGRQRHRCRPGVEREGYATTNDWRRRWALPIGTQTFW